MKKKLFLALAAVMCLLFTGCSSDDSDEPNIDVPSALKTGYWTNSTDFEDGTQTEGILMYLDPSGECYIAMYDFNTLEFDLTAAQIRYDNTTGKGKVTFPANMKYPAATYDFKVLQDDMIEVSIDSKTRCYMSYLCQELNWDEVYELTLAELDLDITDGPLSSDMIVSGDIDLGYDYSDNHTRAGILGSAIGALSSLFSSAEENWFKQTVLEELYKINCKLDLVNSKLDDISTKIAQMMKNDEWRDRIDKINNHNALITAINNNNLKVITEMKYALKEYTGKDDPTMDELMATLDKESNSSYEKARAAAYKALKGWMGNGSKNDFLLDIINFTDYLQGVICYSDGKGMPAIYDRIIYETTAWEHEGYHNRNAFRHEDVSVIYTSSFLSRLFVFLVEADKDHYGENLPSYKADLDLLKTKVKAFCEFYEKTGVEERNDVSVCQIPNAHFIITHELTTVDYTQWERWMGKGSDWDSRYTALVYGFRKGMTVTQTRESCLTPTEASALVQYYNAPLDEILTNQGKCQFDNSAYLKNLGTNRMLLSKPWLDEDIKGDYHTIWPWGVSYGKDVYTQRTGDNNVGRFEVDGDEMIGWYTLKNNHYMVNKVRLNK